MLFNNTIKWIEPFVPMDTELVKGSEKATGEEEKESAELKRCLEIIPDDDDVTIKAIPLYSKSPTIVDYKIYKEGRKSLIKIIRADELVKDSSKRAGEELTQESAKKQKVDDDKETTELNQLIEIIPDEEDVAIDAIPLAVKSPRIVNWMIYKEGKKSYYQIIRADGSLKMYMFFRQILKSFDKEDLEDLYKLTCKRDKAQKEQEANIALIETYDDVQVKINADYQIAERLQEE
nr:hypothetical protein [Tanacetum cinerariifolium]